MTSSANRICSGLQQDQRSICPRHQACQRYVHWAFDRRSEFNLCAGDKTWPHFLGVEQVKEAAGPQKELFA